MNQGKLEVVKQEMARENIDILGISELKWTGMGEFNSDDHYIYYCRQILYHCAIGKALREVSRSVLNESIKPISSPIPKMSAFTLAISCLTTSNLC